MTTDKPTALENKTPEYARKSAVRAIMLGPLVVGVAFLAVLVLTIGSVLAALGSGGDVSGSARDCSASIACRLASTDAGTELDPDSRTVHEYQAVLNVLGLRCINTSKRLGGLATKSQQLLSEEGMTENLLIILRNVEASIPANAPPMECAEIFASYVEMRSIHA